MNYTKKIFSILFFLLLTQNLSFAEIPHFVDFKSILNESDAGKKAQIFLKNKLDNGVKTLRGKETKLREEEKNVIQQKKILSPEDYKKKVANLRKKVSSLQKERNSLLETVAKQRSEARSQLLKALNPIINEYMKEKKIRMVIDKKGILLADKNLDITKEVMSLLNKNLKSIKFN